MEKLPKLNTTLCQSLLSNEFELDIGNISESLVYQTVELYVEAIAIYTSFIAENMDNIQVCSLAKKRYQYYQDKIKRLLARREVQQCLVGKKSSTQAIDLQKQIERCNQSAPEQAKALIEFYKNSHRRQEKLIAKNLQEQSKQLNERIQRRSRNKSIRSDSIKKERRTMIQIEE